ncbi:MAG: hypothetical protein IJ956_08505, partial [Akkermansia sp.]|nr:hypothetical protein [Akkermansia sp.]
PKNCKRLEFYTLRESILLADNCYHEADMLLDLLFNDKTGYSILNTDVDFFIHFMTPYQGCGRRDSPASVLVMFRYPLTLPGRFEVSLRIVSYRNASGFLPGRMPGRRCLFVLRVLHDEYDAAERE